MLLAMRRAMLTRSRRIPRSTALFGALLLVGLAVAGRSEDVALASGDEVARRINARDDGATFFGEIRMELLDPRGATRVREIRTLRRDVGGERETLFVFELPKDVRGTGLLIRDHTEAAREDEQWLYLPAARRVRRIASGDRGGYFVGTDFTYDDMKNGTKLSLADYRFTTLRREAIDGVPCTVLQAEAVDADVADELGYSRILFWVDESIWMARRAEFWDRRGRALKTITVGDIRQVDGIWTAHALNAVNEQSGHRTLLTLERVRYGFPVSDDMFTERALERGQLQVP